jgi:hypothetical protein
VKNLEIPYILSAYAMGCVIYFINRNKDYLTVSETAANNKFGRQAFFWGLLVSGILYEFLMFKWVIPHYHLGHLFSVITVILFVFQVLTGIIPARGKRLNTAHLANAFGLGLSMTATVFFFAAHAGIHNFIRALCAVLGIVMICLIATTHKLSSTKYFRQQNIFFACWHIAVLTVVYFG